MSSPPRILLLSAAGIALYLGLSLYHGHQLRKYPEQQGGRAEETNWVQVSTTEHGGGRVQPRPGPADEQGGTAPPATIAELGAQPRATSEQKSPAEDPAQVGPLREALARERAAKEQAVELARRLQAELTPARQEQAGQEADLGRLREELKQARTRAVIAEGQLEQARLKAEAMFKYGQEQSRLFAPARQEVESLKARLQETSMKLHQAQQQISELQARATGAPGSAATEAAAPAN